MAKRIKSGIKRVEIAERNRQRNIAVKSEMKTRIKQAVSSLETAGDNSVAKTAVSSIDRAAKKGVIHPNKAARLKSRLMKRLNNAATAAAK